MGLWNRSLGGRLSRRRRKSVLSVLVAAAALVVFPALSGAIPTQAPDVTTEAPSPVTNTAATLNGTINPNDPDAGADYTFSWGQTTAYGNNETGTSPAGTTPQDVSAPISGLSPRTTYHYRLCASNLLSITPSCGDDVQFTTPDAPTAVAGAATSVGTNGATLNGTVNPNGANVTSTFFKYGTSSAYGSQSSASPAPGSGRSPVSVSATLTGLAAGTTFHYTLCAVNAYSPAGGSCDGTDRTFKTNTPPTASLIADKTSGPTPLAVTFDGSGSSDSDGGSIQSWSMTFGDGGTAGTTGAPPANIQHTYTTAANRNATLTVTDNQGAQGSITVGIHVTANQTPVAQLSVAPTSGTAPLDVSFNGSASADPDGIPLKSWTLDFLDGSPAQTGTGSVPNPINHTYTAPGTYNAKLTVIDSSDASAFKTVTVTVNAPPTISVADVTVTEAQIANFVVTLSAVSSRDITVDYLTSGVTATEGADYTKTQGTLTIKAGTCGPLTTACQISVPTTEDSIFEGAETFTLTLSNPNGASFAKGTATGTINDNDAAPLVMIANGSQLEGNAGSVIGATQTWTAGGSLTVVDAKGLTPGGQNPFYIGSPGSFSAPAGPFTFSTKNGNTLTNVSCPNASCTASGTQIAFQPRPVSLNILLCDAATSGADPAHCAPTVAGTAVTVNYTTRDRTPVKAGQDYVPQCSVTGTSCRGPVAPPITINPGASSATLTISLIPNTIDDPVNDRFFFVSLLSATNASVRWDLGTVFITDDDAPNPPSAATGDASGIGPNQATVAALVNPKGQSTTAYIEYGTSTGYGTKGAAQVLSGSGDQALSFILSGLSPSTQYHYRVVATHADNAAGYGEDKTFTTLAPPAPPPPPPPVGPPPPPPTDISIKNVQVTRSVRSATVGFNIDPGHFETEVFIQYGPEKTYELDTAPETIPANSPDHVLFTLTKLSPQTLYYFHIVARHPHNLEVAGMTGDDRTFTTRKGTRMHTSLRGRTAKAAANGLVPLTVNCTGSWLAGCRGRVYLQLGDAIAGSKPLSVLTGHHKLVRIKLKPKVFRLLMQKGRLRLDVTISLQTGDGAALITKTITVLAPASRK